MSRLAIAVAFGMALLASPTFAQVCDPKKEVCPPPPCDPSKEVCPCDPKTEVCGGADCSPGFYKNHVDAWCPDSDAVACPSGQTYSCSQLYYLLCAECGASKAQRETAKACLDALSPADICDE